MKELKRQIIFIILFGITSLLLGLYKDLRLKKYHDITPVGRIKNEWILYSGIRYFGTIEYQIYPCFIGTKQECKIMRYSNDVILDKKLEHYKDLLGK